MIGRIEQRVDLRDGHSLLRLSQFYDFVAGAHLAFLQDAEVESRPSAGRQQCCHPGLVHSNADAIARHAWCSDLEKCTTDSITVADTNGIVRQPLDREILAELSVYEVSPLQLLLPVAIRFDLVDEDGLLFTPVTDQVALTVSFQIQLAYPTAATHRIFPDRGVYRATLPLDITWKSDIYRQQSRHVPLHFDGGPKVLLTTTQRTEGDDAAKRQGRHTSSRSASPSQRRSSGRGADQSRVVTSWTSHVLPSGSVKHENDL